MSLTPKVTGAPAVIWLVYGDLDHDDKHSNFPEVTWCEDAQFDSDVRYVRSDFFANTNKSRWAATEKLLAENERLRSALSIIAGYEQCIDNTLGNVEIARIALEQKP